MPWPPVLPPAGNTDTTVAGSGHHADTLHNRTANALSDLVTEVSTLRSRTGLMVAFNHGTLTLTDQAQALNWLGGTDRYNARANLLGFTQVRLIAQVAVASASVNTPKLILRHHTSAGQAFSSYVDIGSPEVNVPLSAVGSPASNWINLVAGAKTDVYLAVLQSGGDGAQDPSLGNIYAEFR